MKVNDGRVISNIIVQSLKNQILQSMEMGNKHEVFVM